MKIRIHYNDGSSKDYTVFGFCVDEATKRLDMTVIVYGGQDMQHINWSTVTRIENLEPIR